jgi:hypothetical protein
MAIDGVPKYPKFLTASSIVLVACIAAAFAWWWWRSGAATGIDHVDLWLTYIAMVLFVPGWFIVGMLDNSQTQLATKLTDILIPVLSGLIWGSLALIIPNFSKMLRKYVHGLPGTSNANSRDHSHD